MTDVRVMYVDVYVACARGASFDVLCLRRAAGQGRAGAWETVHGHIQDGETPVAAARRELREETGFASYRLYNLSRVEAFYLHGDDTVALIPVFAAIMAAPGPPQLSPEHDAAEWLAADDAMRRFVWPRERRAVADLRVLLAGGDAGPVEGNLRVD